jgi:hypothetical protein
MVSVMVGHGRAFIVLFPEDPHRRCDCGVFIKLAGPPHPHFAGVEVPMYAAFGDKGSLFRGVMERHRAWRMTYMRQALGQPSLREVVAELNHALN